MNPSGNITALVEGPVPAEKYGTAAKKITAVHGEVEQTGFISADESGYFLNMAGGEFCGNATLSAAAVFAAKESVPEGKESRFSIKVSGEETPVNVSVTLRPGDVYEGEAVMPLCKKLSTVNYELHGRVFSLPTVEFGGITHIIFNGQPDEIPAEEAARIWCAGLGVKCLGIMFTDPGAYSLTPLVYTPGAGTMCRESSCASGTTAAGIYLAEKAGKEIDITFTEPRGTLRIKAGGGKAPVLAGTIIFEKTGFIEI